MNCIAVHLQMQWDFSYHQTRMRREFGPGSHLQAEHPPDRRPRAPCAAMRVLAMVDSHAHAWVIMAERIAARRPPRGPAHHCL